MNTCRLSGTIQNETWAIRFPFTESLYLDEAHFVRLITNDDMPGVPLQNLGFIVAVSEVPGDLDPPDERCKRTMPQSTHVFDVTQQGSSAVAACPLKPNTMYYLNVRPRLPHCATPDPLDPSRPDPNQLEQYDCRVEIFSRPRLR